MRHSEYYWSLIMAFSKNQKKELQQCLVATVKVSMRKFESCFSNTDKKMDDVDGNKVDNDE